MTEALRLSSVQAAGYYGKRARRSTTLGSRGRGAGKHSPASHACRRAAEQRGLAGPSGRQRGVLGRVVELALRSVGRRKRPLPGDRLTEALTARHRLAETEFLAEPAGVGVEVKSPIKVRLHSN